LGPSGPRASGKKYALLSDKSYAELLDFKKYAYFSDDTLDHVFGYGLGVMDFTSMDWGFERHGTYYGHSGLTYQFGSQSGVNYKHNFSASWVSAAEIWIGLRPDSGQDVFLALVYAIDKYRSGHDGVGDAAFDAKAVRRYILMQYLMPEEESLRTEEESLGTEEESLGTELEEESEGTAGTAESRDGGPEGRRESERGRR
jgi:hypothetical protein